MSEEKLMYLMTRIELMSEEEYVKFSVEIARDSFRLEIDGMADSDFKDFVVEHFDKIVGDEPTC